MFYVLKNQKLKMYRNKNCIECPQNEREDVVWRKGYKDGFEVALHYVNKMIDQKLDSKKKEEDERISQNSNSL